METYDKIMRNVFIIFLLCVLLFILAITGGYKGL